MHPEQRGQEPLGAELGAEPSFVVPVRESSKMVRYLLGASAAGGADATRLAGDLGLPGWVLQRDEAMISPDYALRLWELAEHALEDPHLAITFAQRYQPGELDLYAPARGHRPPSATSCSTRSKPASCASGSALTR